MTEADVRELFGALPGARLFIASEKNGAPEAALGDTFCYYDPAGTGDQKWPFATIVTHDTPGWDEASHLDRPDAFRLNLHVGRTHVPAVSDDIDHRRSERLQELLAFDYTDPGNGRVHHLLVTTYYAQHAQAMTDDAVAAYDRALMQHAHRVDNDPFGRELRHWLYGEPGSTA